MFFKLITKECISDFRHYGIVVEVSLFVGVVVSVVISFREIKSSMQDIDFGVIQVGPFLRRQMANAAKRV